MFRRTRKPPGFTRAEVLVVVVIAVLIIGLLLPGVQKVRVTGNRDHCRSRLKQIVLAVLNYASANEDKLPNLMTNNAAAPSVQPCRGTILFHLLPYFELDSLYKKLQATGDSVPIAAFSPSDEMKVKSFQCPTDPGIAAGLTLGGDPGWGASSYAANYLLFGTEIVDVVNGETHYSAYASKYRIDKIPDGSANTIMFAEKSASYAAGTVNACTWHGWSTVTPTPGDVPAKWTRGPVFGYTNNWADLSAGYPLPQFNPAPYTASTGNLPVWDKVQGYHSGGILIGLADGAVRVVGSSISNPTWTYLVCPADRQDVGGY